MAARRSDPAPAPGTTRNTRARFEQWASNPQCQANTLSAVHGVKMSDVAKAAGLAATFGASPFALARGQQFEANLLDNRGNRLIPELEREGLLEGTSGQLVDLRIRANGGSDRSLTDLDDAIARTSTLLAELGALRGAAVADGPSVIAGATPIVPGPTGVGAERPQW